MHEENIANNSGCTRNSSSEIVCTKTLGDSSVCSDRSAEVTVTNKYNSNSVRIKSKEASYAYSNKPVISSITKEGGTSSVSNLTEGVKYDFHGTYFNDIGTGTSPENDVVVIFSKTNSSGTTSYSTSGCSVNNYGTKLTCTVPETKATTTNDWSGVSVSIKNKFKDCSNSTSDPYSSTVTIKGNN